MKMNRNINMLKKTLVLLLLGCALLALAGCSEKKGLTKCETCGGKGYITNAAAERVGVRIDCPICGGTGYSQLPNR